MGFAPSRLSDHEVIRACNHNESLRPPESDPDADSAAFIASLPDIDPVETDETMEYMVDLLESAEVDFDSFRCQLLSVGYSEAEITTARDAADV
jgi:hypothetical protein